MGTKYNDITPDIMVQGLYDIFYGKTQEYKDTNGFRQFNVEGQYGWYKYDFELRVWDVRDKLNGNGFRVTCKSNTEKEAINIFITELNNYYESKEGQEQS